MLRKAFEDGLIPDYDAWRSMANARNITSHVYDDSEAQELCITIYKIYFNILEDLDDKLALDYAKQADTPPGEHIDRAGKILYKKIER